MVRGQTPIPVFNAPAAIPEMSSFPAPPPLPVSTAPNVNEIPSQPVQQVMLQQQPQQRHHVAVPIEEDVENVKADVEEEEELGEKFETLTFGFAVQDDLLNVEKATADDVANADIVVDRDVDVPTPLQDEFDVEDDLPPQLLQVSIFNVIVYYRAFPGP